MRMNSEGKNPARLLRFGLIALLVANVVSYLTRRTGAVPESVADPLNGLLMGVAIALLLLSIARRREDAPRA